MGNAFLYVWDATAQEWVKAVGNADGKLIIDPSEILEDDPTDGEVGKAPTSNWAYDHNAADGYHISMGSYFGNPNDNFEYLVLPGSGGTGVASVFGIPILKAGTIKSMSLYWWGTSVVGSGEDISVKIRVNNTTDILVATLGNTDAIKLFANSSLDIPVVVGDFFAIKIVTPTWVTNPTGVYLWWSILIEH